ncbi:MAG: DUF554 domain-containing protein [Bacteroidaceae bacterium]|nr:DUF554 domain-containing protein [Bacteroidaceae bacterium]
MTGTIVNTCAILAGSLAGSFLRRGIKPQYQQVLFTAMGLASLSLGFNAVCRNMPQSHHPVLFVVSLAIGGLIGTIIDLNGRFKRLVDRKKENAESPSFNSTRSSLSTPQSPSLDNTFSSPRLAEGLSTGILLFCIGTLSIVGPINSALLGDETFLLTNATLDLVTSGVLAATYGIGMALAAPVLFLWQGSIYLLATLCGNVISDELLCEMSIVGGTLIAASGLSILEIKDCKTLNLLPSLFIPVLYFAARALLGI